MPEGRPSLTAGTSVDACVEAMTLHLGLEEVGFGVMVIEGTKAGRGTHRVRARDVSVWPGEVRR